MNITKVTTVDDVNYEEILTSDNYTATVRLTPTPQDLEAFIRCAFYDFNNTPTHHGIMTTLNGLQGAFSDSFPMAAKYLSMLLVNDSGDTDIPHNFTLSTDIIGYADSQVSYSGADIRRGSYNVAESSIVSTHGKLKCHHVYDFPTHAANGSFNKILFYPDLIHSHTSTPVPGVHANIGPEIKLTEFYLNHPDNVLAYVNSGATQYYSLMCISDAGEYLVKYHTSKRVFVGLADGTKLEFPEITGTPESSYSQSHTISYFNGSFWLSERYTARFGEGSDKTLSALKLSVDTTGVKVTGEKVSFNLAGLTYNGSYLKLFQVIQVGQLLFVYFYGHSSSSNAGTRYNNVAVYDTSYNLITSRVSPIDLTSSLGHFYDSKRKIVYFTNGTNIVPYDVATSTFGASIAYSNNSHMRESPNRTTAIGAYSTSVASSGGTSYESNARFIGPVLIGKAEFKKPVIEIALEEPLNKTNVETLKLIFDFEITTD